MPLHTVRLAKTDADYAAARGLIIEYVEWLAEDFCSIGFEAEILGLKQMYSPPKGLLLLASNDGEAVGCIAYREIGERLCEMKRLYVAPSARGQDLGRRLVRDLIEAARSAGYTRMQLDTLPKLAAAHALYKSLGFVEIEPYYENPIEGVTFMALDLG